MSQDDEWKIKGLPENAYTELDTGEEYVPVMPQLRQEINSINVRVGDDKSCTVHTTDRL